MPCWPAQFLYYKYPSIGSIFCLYDLYYSIRSTNVSHSLILIRFLSYLTNFWGDHSSWGPNFLGTKCPGDQISRGPNFLGTKFLGDQIFRGPNFSGTKKVWGPNFWGPNFSGTKFPRAQITRGPNFLGPKKLRGPNEFGDQLSYSPNQPQISPNLIFCFIKMAHCGTYACITTLVVKKEE